MPRTFVQVHRLLAVALVLFIVSHLLIHLSAIWSAEMHMRVLGGVQGVYRNPIVEPLLIAAIGLQALVGARLLAMRLSEADKGVWSWIQIISGGVLLVFLALHTSAALVTRHGLGLDTNFYWIAATLQLAPFKYGFFPYYAIAILAVFAHLAAAIRFGWGDRAGALPVTLLATGACFAVLVLSAFGGAFYAIELPPENAAYFDRLGF